VIPSMNLSKFTTSLESLTSDLHLWDVSTTQVGIKESRAINYYPLSSIENSETITFNIPGQNKLYLDFIEVITKVKLENIPNDKPQVSVNNNLANSLWKNVSVSVGGVNITQSFDYAYAVSRFFDIALNTTPDRSEALLYQMGFLMDEGASKAESEKLTVYKVEAVTNPPTAELTVGNPALPRRIERFTPNATTPGVRVGTLIAPLGCSLLDQGKLLPDNLDIQIGLSKKEPKFCLQAPANTDARLTITNVYLKVHYKIPVDEACEGINMRLLKEPTRYESEAKIVTFHQFPYGVAVHKFNNLFTGKLPKFFVCGINNRAAYAGNPHRNPWTFFRIKKAQLWNNGEPYYPKELDGQAELYDAFQQGVGYKIKGSCLINPTNFGIHNLLSCPLTADRNVRHHMNLMSTGVVDLEIELEHNTGQDYCLVVYAIYDRLIEIDNFRQITLI